MGRGRSAFHPGQEVLLQQRPYTFAQINLSVHFLLATRRRTIHSGWPVEQEQSGTEHANREIQAQTLQANLATFTITSAE
jgi:hypothetical protein